MSRLNQLTEDQTISNKAWQLFNTELNNGLDTEDARTEAVLSAEKIRADYDSNFMPSSNPTQSDIIYEKSMQQFDKLVKEIRSIWS